MYGLKLTEGKGLEKLERFEAEKPNPGVGEVQVRWHATSLNYHDYLVAVGAIPVAENRLPMSDGAGEITAVGEGVSKWQIGDRVMSLFFPDWLDGRPTAERVARISGESFDGYSVEYSCINEQALTRCPSNLSYEQAATLPCAGLTAWRALMVDGQVQPGETVLVQGSGGMSIFGLQIAKAAGANVIATTSSDEKAETLKALGADKVINYKTDEKWGKSVYKETGGVHHILDVGGPATLGQSVEAARVDGTITLIGILGGRDASIILPKAFFKHLHLNGIAVGSRRMQEDYVAAVEVNNMIPQISHTFALDDLADAFTLQETGKHIGKITVTI